MAVPAYQQFIEPVLRLLAANPPGLLARDVYEAAADELGVSASAREELLPSGRQAIYRNRVGWAYDRLKRAGLTSSPRRGFWQISAAGQDFAATSPPPLSPDEISRLATGFLHVHLRPADGLQLGQPDIGTDFHREASAGSSPEERLEEAFIELRTSARDDLREAVLGVSPAGFERLVLDLLHGMGYGTNRDDLRNVGGTGDAGIDGVISLDRLGLEKVYVQAKRWQETVGRPQIQAFYGALAGQRAKRGVFITTSDFSQQARDYAASVEGIVLVDGKGLATFMIDHEVGVSVVRVLKIPKVDSDYFESI